MNRRRFIKRGLLFVPFVPNIIIRAASPIPFNPQINTVVAAGGSSVGYDTQATPGGGTSTNTRVISITVANNSNRLLIIGAGSGTVTPAVDGIVSSITSDQGGTFSLISGTRFHGTSWTTYEMWRLIAPAAATHSVTVTFAASVAQCWAGAISLYNCHQTTPIGTANGAGGTSSTPSAGSITIPSNGYGVAGITTDSENSLTWTTGTEKLKTLNVGSDTAYSMAVLSTTGSQTFACSTGNEHYSISAIPISPA